MVTSDNSFYKILLIRYNGDGTVSRGYFSKFTDSKPNSKVRFTVPVQDRRSARCFETYASARKFSKYLSSVLVDYKVLGIEGKNKLNKVKKKFKIDFIDIDIKSGRDVFRFSHVFLAFDKAHAGRMARRYLSEVYDACDKIVIKEL